MKLSDSLKYVNKERSSISSSNNQNELIIRIDVHISLSTIVQHKLLTLDVSSCNPLFELSFLSPILKIKNNKCNSENLSVLYLDIYTNLKSIEIGNKNVMFVLAEKNDNVMRASNNIENAHITYADVLGTYDIVSNSKLYITKDAIKKIEEAYK